MKLKLVAWKCWRELRTKFWMSTALIVLHASFLVGFFWHVKSGAGLLSITESDAHALQDLTGNYLTFLSETWAGSGMMLMLAVLLSTGGVNHEQKTGTLGVTLGLPVKPETWVFTQTALSFSLVLVLVLLSGVLIFAGGLLIGASILTGPVFFSTALMALAGMGSAGVTVAVTARCERASTTIMIAAGIVLLLGLFPSGWNIWTDAQRLLEVGSWPIGMITICISAMLLGPMFAARRFATLDH